MPNFVAIRKGTNTTSGTIECENFKIDNLENGDVDEYDDDEWDIKWQDWRTDDEIGIVELACLFLTWRTENEK